MLKHPELTEQRIIKASSAIESRIYPLTAPVKIEAWHVNGEPVPAKAAFDAPYEPFAVGDPWGPMWGTTWFRISGSVPESWSVKEVVLLVRLTDETNEGFTAEGLIYSGGKIIRALNVNRRDIAVAAAANGGEPFEFYIEAAANPSNGAWNDSSKKTKPIFTLAQAELATVDRAAFEYFYDFKVASELMLALPANSQRRAELRHSLNESLNRLDPDAPASIPAARAALEGVMAKTNGGTAHVVSAIGHAHIDTAWLWPLREAIRKCARTFSTALDYMERYPEYVFGCSQAQQYAWMKAHYPAIYQGIRERCKSGQWEPIGSMWVEVDCNLASGESLIRQILHGKRFFKNEFNYETKDVWLPDVFGYSAALPQIFAGCGIDLFVTQKISWNQFNKFPHHTFLWEGLDGTQIFTHFPPADTYSGRLNPAELRYLVDNFKEHGRATRSLYLYGFGDGGGGPTVGMLEQAKRMRDLDGLPKVQLEPVREFSKKAKQDARDLPLWVGELYLELHRGTYTTRARNKLGNRKSEFLLRNAEFFDAISFAMAPGRQERAVSPARAIYDVVGQESQDSHLHSRALERAWKLLLLNQFHDIIPGSSIGWVYKDSARDYRAIEELGNSVIASSLASYEAQIDTAGLKAPVCIDNTLNFERTEVVELAPGNLALVRVPSAGYTVVDAAEIPAPSRAVSIRETQGEILVENGLVSLRLGSDGLIKSLIDLEADGREIIPFGAAGNLFQLHTDTPNSWEAWDVDLFYKERVTDIRELERIEVIESHPLRARVRIERSFGKSKIVQDVIVNANSWRIDFETEVEWQECQKLLKVAFPVNIISNRATYEIQFGHVERPTHYNTSWDQARFEVCAHKWADLSEADYGVALLNDCKYGYDIYKNVIRLSLLRSPTDPDPEADRGHHRFTYALLPHSRDLRRGRVIEEAYQLNVPLRLRSLNTQKGAMPPQRSFFKTDRPGIIIESVKVADDGTGIIVRLYEAYGARGPVCLSTSIPVKEAYRADMLENPGEPLNVENASLYFEVAPFEIVSLFLKPLENR